MKRTGFRPKKAHCWLCLLTWEKNSKLDGEFLIAWTHFSNGEPGGQAIRKMILAIKKFRLASNFFQVSKKTNKVLLLISYKSLRHPYFFTSVFLAKFSLHFYILCVVPSKKLYGSWRGNLHIKMNNRTFSSRW